MQWSKLKSRIKDFICSELKDRIDFHLTSYRKSHDGADKIWITIDGEKAYIFGHYPYETAKGAAYHEGLNAAQVKDFLQLNEIHSPQDFGAAMRLYLDMPIAEALESANPIIRAFAVIDRRVGKRAIDKLKISDFEHSLVKAFFSLRCRATE